MFRFYTVPYFIKSIYKSYHWNVKTKDKTIYLTFDDGPIPNVTEFVLEQLAIYNAKGTFFCVGENIQKHPHLFKRLLNEGHGYGNHTQNHVKGWKLNNDNYFQNIQHFEHSVSAVSNEKTSPLFRPPYGRIKDSQGKILRKKYKIIMWEVLTCDYDKTLSPEKCLKHAIRNTRIGSIVLFHDSLKAEKNLRYVLPLYLKFFSDLGYCFKPLHEGLF